MDKLALYIEGLIFAASAPVSRKDIRYALENAFEVKIPNEDIEAALAELEQKYMSDDFPFEICEIAEGFQFLTKPAYHGVIGAYLKQISKRRLSKVALETLAIIAYKQPVTKSELEKIRGVNCDYAIQKLLEKELIEIDGRSDSAGRPLVYVTSEKFMDHFGLKNISDLPKLKDLQTAENIFADDQLDEPIPEDMLAADRAESEDVSDEHEMESEDMDVQMSEETSELPESEVEESELVESEEQDSHQTVD